MYRVFIFHSSVCLLHCVHEKLGLKMRLTPLIQYIHDTVMTPLICHMIICDINVLCMYMCVDLQLFYILPQWTMYVHVCTYVCLSCRFLHTITYCRKVPCTYIIVSQSSIFATKATYGVICSPQWLLSEIQSTEKNNYMYLTHSDCLLA